MKSIYIICISLLAAISLAAAYTPEQQATVDGVRLSFQIGQAYGKATQGQDVPAFNALVDQWNVWVYQNFGQDANLLMQKMNAPPDLTKPIAIRNNTTITTNDANLLTEREQYANRAANPGQGEAYLPFP